MYNGRILHAYVKSGGRKVKPCKSVLFYPNFWRMDGGKESYLQVERLMCKNMKTTKNVYHLYICRYAQNILVRIYKKLINMVVPTEGNWMTEGQKLEGDCSHCTFCTLGSLYHIHVFSNPQSSKIIREKLY